jgi:predicted nucleic acid-binding protein
LARIEHLFLLPKLAQRIIVPSFVWQEVTQTSRTAPGAEDVLAQRWIEVAPADARRVGELARLVDRGEAEALALTEAFPDPLLLIDERKGRNLAASLGIRRIGTLGLLAKAKQAGLIPRVRPLVDSLISNNIYIRPAIIVEVLAAVGEK